MTFPTYNAILGPKSEYRDVHTYTWYQDLLKKMLQLHFASFQLTFSNRSWTFLSKEVHNYWPVTTYMAELSANNIWKIKQVLHDRTGQKYLAEKSRSGPKCKSTFAGNVSSSLRKLLEIEADVWEYRSGGCLKIFIYFISCLGTWTAKTSPDTDNR